MIDLGKLFFETYNEYVAIYKNAKPKTNSIYSGYTIYLAFFHLL